jgi:DNA polymerase-3 subunit beta
VEQLNIEGKRSGSGFVAHKTTLVSALSRALAERVIVNELTLGRKGLLGYLKSLGGSNVIKVVPSNGDAGGSQVTGKKLRIICGSNTSTLGDSDFIGEKTPMSICDVRISPKNAVTPNIGASELAEALSRVLPFTARDDNRPVLQCVYFMAKDGKLTLVSADGFTLAVVTLDYDGEGQVLIKADELRGVANALKRAKRARVSFDNTTHIPALTIDTELIRYKWSSADGSYPDYEKLIPADFNTFAHFDTVEAIKAIGSLRALDAGKEFALDLTIGNGKILMADPDDKGQAELTADTEGEVKIRVNGSYIATTLRACGGMVDLSLTNAYSPMLFSLDGYQVVVMPMMTNEAKSAEPVPTEQAEAEPAEEKEVKPAEVKTEKPKKAKRNREKEPVKA